HVGVERRRWGEERGPDEVEHAQIRIEARQLLHAAVRREARVELPALERHSGGAVVEPVAGRRRIGLGGARAKRERQRGNQRENAFAERKQRPVHGSPPKSLVFAPNSPADAKSTSNDT